MGPRKLFQVHEAVRPTYLLSKPDNATFHFAHGDLSVANIPFDPTAGVITGAVDWGVAGFRPAWAAAVCASWFDNGYRRFVIEDYQGNPDGYGDETKDDAQSNFGANSNNLSRIRCKLTTSIH